MGKPSVKDYTSAEWRHRDSRREIAYEIARKLGYTRKNARQTATEVADERHVSPPAPAEGCSRHVSRSAASDAGGLDPFPWIRFPDSD